MTGDGVLQQVLERAFSDQQFRIRLEAGLEAALEGEGYSLGQEDLQQLRSVLDEGKDTFATGLDQRLSQSGVSLSPQALLRAKSKKTDKQEGVFGHADTVGEHKQTARPVPAVEDPRPGKQKPAIGSQENGDEQETDYEVETD